MVMYLLGRDTCVPISWMCKKQGCQSHSSTEAEVISLDTGLRMEGLSALAFWDEVITVFYPDTPKNNLPKQLNAQMIDGPLIFPQPPVSDDVDYNILQMVDWVPPNLPPHPGFARLVILEDNDAVIKLILKGRSLALRHIARVHRIDLDWLIARVREDPGIDIKFFGTKYQIAHILTKAIYTSEQWYVFSTLHKWGNHSRKRQRK